MSDLLITAIVVGSVFSYAIVGGVVGARLTKWVNESGHPGPIMGGIGWPLVVPAWLGTRLSARLDRPKLPAARVL